MPHKPATSSVGLICAQKGHSTRKKEGKGPNSPRRGVPNRQPRSSAQSLNVGANTSAGLGPNECAEEYENLCRLYVFAIKIQDPDAKDAACSALVSKINHDLVESCNGDNRGRCFPSEKAIKIMYEGTGENSMGRMIFVDCYLRVAISEPAKPLDAAICPIESFRDLLSGEISINSCWKALLDLLPTFLYT